MMAIQVIKRKILAAAVIAACSLAVVIVPLSKNTSNSVLFLENSSLSPRAGRIRMPVSYDVLMRRYGLDTVLERQFRSPSTRIKEWVRNRIPQLHKGEHLQESDDETSRVLYAVRVALEKNMSAAKSSDHAKQEVINIAISNLEKLAAEHNHYFSSYWQGIAGIVLYEWNAGWDPFQISECIYGIMEFFNRPKTLPAVLGVEFEELWKEFVEITILYVDAKSTGTLFWLAGEKNYNAMHLVHMFGSPFDRFMNAFSAAELPYYWAGLKRLYIAFSRNPGALNNLNRGIGFLRNLCKDELFNDLWPYFVDILISNAHAGSIGWNELAAAAAGVVSWAENEAAYAAPSMTVKELKTLRPHQYAQLLLEIKNQTAAVYCELVKKGYFAGSNVPVLKTDLHQFSTIDMTGPDWILAFAPVISSPEMISKLMELLLELCGTWSDDKRWIQNYLVQQAAPAVAHIVLNVRNTGGVRESDEYEMIRRIMLQHSAAYKVRPAAVKFKQKVGADYYSFDYFGYENRYALLGYHLLTDEHSLEKLDAALSDIIISYQNVLKENPGEGFLARLLPVFSNESADIAEFKQKALSAIELVRYVHNEIPGLDSDAANTVIYSLLPSVKKVIAKTGITLQEMQHAADALATIYMFFDRRHQEALLKNKAELSADSFMEALFIRGPGVKNLYASPATPALLMIEPLLRDVHDLARLTEEGSPYNKLFMSIVEASPSYHNHDKIAEIINQLDCLFSAVADPDEDVQARFATMVQEICSHIGREHMIPFMNKLRNLSPFIRKYINVLANEAFAHAYESTKVLEALGEAVSFMRGQSSASTLVVAMNMSGGYWYVCGMVEKASDGTLYLKPRYAEILFPDVKPAPRIQVVELKISSTMHHSDNFSFHPYSDKHKPLISEAAFCAVMEKNSYPVFIDATQRERMHVPDSTRGMRNLMLLKEAIRVQGWDVRDVYRDFMEEAITLSYQKGSARVERRGYPPVAVHLAADLLGVYNLEESAGGRVDLEGYMAPVACAKAGRAGTAIQAATTVITEPLLAGWRDGTRMALDDFETSKMDEFKELMTKQLQTLVPFVMGTRKAIQMMRQAHDPRKTLFVFDMDFTLVDGADDLSEEIKSMLSALILGGFNVAVVSLKSERNICERVVRPLQRHFEKTGYDPALILEHLKYASAGSNDDGTPQILKSTALSKLYEGQDFANVFILGDNDQGARRLDEEMTRAYPDTSVFIQVESSGDTLYFYTLVQPLLFYDQEQVLLGAA